MSTELNNIDLTPNQRKAVAELLKRYIPDTEVWAYGSRVKFTSTPKSDLDLVAFATPEQKHSIFNLKEAFEESSLPFRVDLFIWNEVPEQFHKNIEAERVVMQEKKERVMGSNWGEIALSDALEFVVDNRGKTVPVCDKGIALIATNCVSNDNLYPALINVRYVSEDIYNSWFRAHPQPNDILLTNKGSKNGAICLVPDPVDFCIAQDMVALRANRSKIDPSYLFAALRSPYIQAQIRQLNVDSVIPHFKKTDFDKLFIPMPTDEEQKSIGKLYLTFSKKIELNRRMNATLEGMAQALFKSWFVDFDPVIDNAIAAGNPIPEELTKRAEVRRQALANGTANREAAKQFSAAFQLTEELGWIPEGWEVKELGAITTELRRGISPKYTQDNGVRVINQRCIRDHSIIYSNARLNDTTKKRVYGRHLQTGDLLINSTGVGTLGRMAQVLSLDEPTVTDSHVTVVRSDPAHYMPYTFGRMMISIEPQVEAMGHGSTGQTELSRADLSVMPVIIPILSIQEQAEALLSEWAIKCEIYSNQNGTLTNLRDTLLPKLISGELRIPDTEKLVEDVL